MFPKWNVAMIDDTSLEDTIVDLSPGWVDIDVSRLYVSIISINPSQPDSTWAPSPSNSLGVRSDTLIARWWSFLESERATWPKKWSHLVLMRMETGRQPVISLECGIMTVFYVEVANVQICYKDLLCNTCTALYFVVCNSKAVDLVDSYRPCIWLMIIWCLHPHLLMPVATAVRDHPL